MVTISIVAPDTTLPVSGSWNGNVFPTNMFLGIYEVGVPRYSCQLMWHYYVRRDRLGCVVSLLLFLALSPYILLSKSLLRRPTEGLIENPKRIHLEQLDPHRLPAKYYGSSKTFGEHRPKSHAQTKIRTLYGHQT